MAKLESGVRVGMHPIVQVLPPPPAPRVSAAESEPSFMVGGIQAEVDARPKYYDMFNIPGEVVGRAGSWYRNKQGELQERNKLKYRCQKWHIWF